MDKNVHKRSLLEVYSSEEEEITDINELQEEFENESTLSGLSGEDSALFGLEIGDTFKDWDSAERQVENHAKESGFGIVRRQLEKNSYGEIVRRTFECQNSRKYRAKKKV